MVSYWLKIKQRLDIAFPLVITVFAASLAFNDLLGGKYGDDEIKLSNARNNSYQWYQAKGIKETILEGQLELIAVLQKSGSLAADKVEVMEALEHTIQTKVTRYNQEKKEILVGSSQLKPEEWVQAIDGKLGQVVGGKEYDTYLATLGEAGNYFDLATMLYQLCLVLGAIGIVLERPRVKWPFFNLTLVLGIAGLVMTSFGMRIAMTVPEL